MGICQPRALGQYPIPRAMAVAAKTRAITRLAWATLEGVCVEHPLQALRVKLSTQSPPPRPYCSQADPKG